MDAIEAIPRLGRLTIGLVKADQLIRALSGIALPALRSFTISRTNPGSLVLRAPALEAVTVDCQLEPASMQFLAGHPALRELVLVDSPPRLGPQTALQLCDVIKTLGQHVVGL